MVTGKHKRLLNELEMEIDVKDCMIANQRVVIKKQEQENAYLKTRLAAADQAKDEAVSAEMIKRINAEAELERMKVG